jgi:hypothetical protein
MITITILDLNDNYPVIVPIADVVINEATDTGAAITMVVATDADIDQNEVLRFTIEKVVAVTQLNPTVPIEFPGVFGVDAETGAITLDKKVNRELVLAYNVTVIVYDHGSDPKSATDTFIITVGDVRCALFDRNLHSRMPLVPTPLLRLNRAGV